MAPDDCKELITALDRKIEARTSELAAARQAQLDIPMLEADLERLHAAKKALDAPQSPAGRRRIGEAVKKRAKKELPVCSECHTPIRPSHNMQLCMYCDRLLHSAACSDQHRCAQGAARAEAEAL